MRFDEDEKPQSFGPVLRRISILAVIVTAVPVMLWSITAFMRTYVAQPVIPSARPLASSVGTNAASAPSADYAAPAPAGKPVVEARATATDADGKSDQLSDTAASAQVLTGTTASIGTASAVPMSSAVQMSAGSPAPQAANRTTANSLGYSPNLPNTASGPWPDPSQAIGAQPSQTANSGADTSDALAASAPLTGPIPLPPRRPKILAMADGTIPLPRKRPADADAAADPPPDEGNFFSHLFGSSH